MLRERTIGRPSASQQSPSGKINGGKWPAEGTEAWSLPFELERGEWNEPMLVSMGRMPHRRAQIKAALFGGTPNSSAQRCPPFGGNPPNASPRMGLVILGETPRIPPEFWGESPDMPPEWGPLLGQRPRSFSKRNDSFSRRHCPNGAIGGNPQSCNHGANAPCYIGRCPNNLGKPPS